MPGYNSNGFRGSSVVERLALGPTGRRFEPCPRIIVKLNSILLNCWWPNFIMI